MAYTDWTPGWVCGICVEWEQSRGNQQIIIMATLLRAVERVQLLSLLPECSDTMGRDGDPINASIMTHSTLHTGAKIISTTKIWLFQACCEWCGLTDGIPLSLFYRRTQIPVLVVNILINSQFNTGRGEKPGKSPDRPLQWVSIPNTYIPFQTILDFLIQPGSRLEISYIAIVMVLMSYVHNLKNVRHVIAINNLDQWLSRVTSTTHQLPWSSLTQKTVEELIVTRGQILIRAGIKKISETGTNIIYYFHYQKISDWWLSDLPWTCF